MHILLSFPGLFSEPDGPGRLMVNQMYVEYLIPKVAKLKTPIVLVHGSNHTGMTWRTTPDGREGWGTYFARRGHPVKRVSGPWGGGQMIQLDWRSGTYMAGSDPRKDGCALAY